MEHLIYLITNYRYLILFPLAIVEGPVLAVIAGFLCANGFLNPWIVYSVLVLGDITGDAVFYSLGKWGIPFFMKSMMGNIDQETDKIIKLRTYMNTHPNKMIPLSKITLGIGFTGILIAGNSRLAFRRFIKLCLLTSALQYLFYLSVGLLFGAAYTTINQYIDLFAALTVLVVLAIFFLLFIQSILKKYKKR